MRILFDQNVPRKLRRQLHGHFVITAGENGWSGSTNGDLLRLAEDAGFDILLSANQNIAEQQNLKGRRISLIVLNSNHWDIIREEFPLSPTRSTTQPLAVIGSSSFGAQSPRLIPIQSVCFNRREASCPPGLDWSMRTAAW